MRAVGRIAGYSVNKKLMSLKVELTESRDDMVEELKNIKEKPKTFLIDNLYFIGEIRSINLNSATTFLVHTQKKQIVNSKLFPLIDKDEVKIRISTETEDTLLSILEKAAVEQNKKPQELLYQLSSFKDVNGMRSIFHLSEAHQRVVMDKLLKILKIAAAASKPDKKDTNV